MPYYRRMDQGLIYELNAANSEQGGEYVPPAELLLVPAGAFTARDGTLYRNSSPKKVIATFKKERVALAIDFDHNIYMRGGGAAIGWINSLELRDGAIWGAKIEWLDNAEYMLRNKRYRYYSPHYLVDSQSREILKLDVVSLVNRPRIAVDSLNQLNNPQQEEAVNTQEQLNAALQDNAKQIQQTIEAQKKSAALETELNSAKKEIETLKGEVQKFKDEKTQEDSAKLKDTLNSFLEKQVKEGKLPPAQKEVYAKVVRSEEELNSLKAALKDAPVILPGADKSGGAEPAQKGAEDSLNTLGYDNEEIELAKSVGLEAKDLAKKE